MDEELPKQLNARYRLDVLIGEGGMGSVYAGWDASRGRRVAIKLMLPPEDDAEVRSERFLREARVAGRLVHPHVVEVFDHGYAAEGAPFLVMELIEGEELAARLEREGRMPASEVVALGRQLSQGLQVAHDDGLVHRDLKPSNVMLQRRPDGALWAKILDFGLAKLLGARDLTRQGAMLGTIDYMAPEQIASSPVGPGADVYALGAVLYRALTGAPLFEESSLAAMVHAHLRKQPPPPSARASGVPPALDAVVLRCLAKAPEDRFASMFDLDVALGEVEASLGAHRRVESLASEVDEPTRHFVRGTVPIPGAPPVPFAERGSPPVSAPAPPAAAPGFFQRLWAWLRYGAPP